MCLLLIIVEICNCFKVLLLSNVLLLIMQKFSFVCWVYVQEKLNSCERFGIKFSGVRYSISVGFTGKFVAHPVARRTHSRKVVGLIPAYAVCFTVDR